MSAHNNLPRAYAQDARAQAAAEGYLDGARDPARPPPDNAARIALIRAGRRVLWSLIEQVGHGKITTFPLGGVGCQAEDFILNYVMYQYACKEHLGNLVANGTNLHSHWGHCGSHCPGLGVPCPQAVVLVCRSPLFGMPVRQARMLRQRLYKHCDSPLLSCDIDKANFNL